MLVTDIIRTSKGGAISEGFYMNGYLKENLDGIPAYLNKAWDVVGIVSGHGKVRIGKSTMASQVCYYIAWLLAGGIMNCHLEYVNGKQTWIMDKKRRPDKPVRFTLEENVVFSADELQTKAVELYNKYGKNQVIMYDEGRQGLDSARSMETVNKGMEDFFQECGFMGHVIIIVLPNYFKLHEDYAIARSLFLIDCFADKKHNRGYYNFYNERQKEFLYFFGKKKLGVVAKYMAGRESFWGKFGSWMPFDKDKYNEMKKVALEKKGEHKKDRKMRLQRDALVWIMYKTYKKPLIEISEQLNKIADVELGEHGLTNCLRAISNMNSLKKGY